MKSQPKTGNNAKKALAIGGGVALAAALIAGAYFLYGKDGAKNRKKVRGWALKMKGEILEKMEKVPEISEEMYSKVIDEASSRYKALKNVDPDELKTIVKELKGHWSSIKKQIPPKAKAVKKAVTKVVKRKPAAKKK